MPKATKKKKEKHADFTKVKLKLGKGKKQASNATDTSFKARSIALPGQNPLARALAAQSDEPTTNQGLTLDEVLLRFRHPNGGVRKEALGGLKDILQVGPEKEIGKVIRALGGIVSDDDAGVRKALLGFIAWYLPALNESVLTPHLPLLLLQTSSALSHIFPEIRIDACKLVSLLLEHVPSQVVGGWPSASSSTASSSRNTLDGGNIILEGLRLAVGLGGEKGMNAQMGKLGANGQLTTLKTLYEFVSCALEGDRAAPNCFDGWLSGGERRNSKGKEKVVNVPGDGILHDGWLLSCGSWGMEVGDDQWDISRLDNSGVGDEQATNEVIAQLYLQLAPLLLSTFLESAPTAFPPSATVSSTTEIPMSLCLTTASLTLTLTKQILKSDFRRNEIHGSVSEFLRRMTPYFPFRGTNSASPTGLSPSMQLNLVYANLAVLLAPPIPALRLSKTNRRQGDWRERIKAVEEAWKVMRETGCKGKKDKGTTGNIWALGEVAEWIVDILAPNTDALAPGLSPTTYATLLPIIWSLLVLPPSIQAGSNQEDDIPTSVGIALLSHLLRQSSASTTRAIGDKFIIGLIQTHEQRHPTLPFFVQSNSPIRPLIKNWVEDLPKTLWELGTKDETASEQLLAFLLEIGHRGATFEGPSLLSGISLPKLTKLLSPFFFLHHPKKGPVRGPFTKLSSGQGGGIKKLALDVAKVWVEWDDEGGLKSAVDEATKGGNSNGGWAAAYWAR